MARHPSPPSPPGPNAPPPRRSRAVLRFLAGLLTIALPLGARAAPAPAASDDEAAALAVVDHLVHQPGAAGSAIAAHTLAAVLAALPPLAATAHGCDWALSPDVAHRQALAGALEWSGPLLGAGSMLAHLAGDPEAAVRRAVARTAWTRGDAPAALARLLADPDPEVRDLARLAAGPLRPAGG
jgi:hypothetical protein